MAVARTKTTRAPHSGEARHLHLRARRPNPCRVSLSAPVACACRGHAPEPSRGPNRPRGRRIGQPRRPPRRGAELRRPIAAAPARESCQPSDPRSAALIRSSALKTQTIRSGSNDPDRHVPLRLSFLHKSPQILPESTRRPVACKSNCTWVLVFKFRPLTFLKI